jgi:hypothetical protein
MRVIFLDIDGVVTSARDNGFEDFNPNVVHWLTFICEQSDAKIVISSTWRFNTTKEFWETIFPNCIHDDWQTPKAKMDGIRGYDVDAWLKRHPEVVQYVILDDDADFHDHQKPHLIQTDPYNGMLFNSLMDLKERLKVEGFPKRDKALYHHPNMCGLTRNG